MNFQARQKKLRQHLVNTRFDALLISHLPNIRYLCGFTGSAGLLLVEEAGSMFFTDVSISDAGSRRGEGREGRHRAEVVYSGLGGSACASRRKREDWTIGIEAEHFTVAEKKRFAKLRPPGIALKDCASHS